jgi:hypothetical protein
VESLNESGGQAASDPVHVSAKSQHDEPLQAEARQVTVLNLNASAGQVAVVPSHFSAMSQTPATARH